MCALRLRRRGILLPRPWWRRVGLGFLAREDPGGLTSNPLGMKRSHWPFLLLAVLLCVLALRPMLADDEDPEQTQEEITMGRTATRAFEHQVHVIASGPQVERLRAILKKLVPQTGRTNLPYRVKLVDVPDVNAVTFPGGFIYVFRGLLDLRPDDSELAGVLGHELAHAALSHGYRKMIGMEALGQLLGSDSGGQMVQLLTVTGVGRHYERSRQVRRALRLSHGYDASGLLNTLGLLQKLGHDNPGLVSHMFATHPPVAERIKRLQAEIHQMKKG